MKTEELATLAKCIRDAQLPIPMCHSLTRDISRRMKDMDQFFDTRRFLLIANKRIDPANLNLAPPVNWKLLGAVEDMYEEFLDWKEKQHG